MYALAVPVGWARSLVLEGDVLSSPWGWLLLAAALWAASISLGGGAAIFSGLSPIATNEKKGGQPSVVDEHSWAYGKPGPCA